MRRKKVYIGMGNGKKSKNEDMENGPGIPVFLLTKPFRDATIETVIAEGLIPIVRDIRGYGRRLDQAPHDSTRNEGRQFPCLPGNPFPSDGRHIGAH